MAVAYSEESNWGHYQYNRRTRKIVRRINAQTSLLNQNRFDPIAPLLRDGELTAFSLCPLWQNMGDYFHEITSQALAISLGNAPLLC